MAKNFLDNVWRYEDGKLYKKHQQSKDKWICLNDNKPNKKGYICVGVTIGGKKKKYLLHRLVYLYHNPTWNIADSCHCNSIDHQNQNKLDNRVQNLNLVTHFQNQQNKTNHAGKEIRGITFYKNAGLKKPWRAQWQENGKRRWKFFESEKEALAYRAEMVKQHYYRPCAKNE